MNRHAFARAALAEIPKLLTLQDRNPHSPTYGCFDRNYWHYRIIDFPSGMAQEFCWPLALAVATEGPDNPWFGDATLREWVRAGVAFAARAAHADGSCDDYFPNERAAGAAAFSLLACMESCALLGFDDPAFHAFFRKRAAWLARHEESGRLSNHQALIVLCLERAGTLLRTDAFAAARERRLARLLAWQDPEGWFPEYDGCDPGYLTLTIGALAQLHEVSPQPPLARAIAAAVAFVAHFVHPDGSFGGELGSRNTWNFFPHGFEIAGRWLPEARPINDRFLEGLATGRAACHADDHIVGHHAWSFLLAARAAAAAGSIPEPPAPPRADGRWHFPNAGLLVERRGAAELFVALNKGGSFRFFRDGVLVVSDTQVSLRTRGRQPRTAVAHLVAESARDVGAGTIVVAGAFHWAMQARMTPLKLVVLRALAGSVGRFAPNLLRRLLQRLLITSRRAAPFQFRRTLAWRDDKLVVTDTVTAPDWNAVADAGIGAAQTSTYVVMSRTFQRAQLQPWLDLTPRVRALAPGDPLSLERAY